ncbi:ArdC-like ssDNA-binding domain-containing protein [Klebsiella quasipneumoniae]|uniref:ArdC-like ssDNA-binding domain-containing protein n=1 Tax=Klebsiella quasipneumoniae TaxID=1463165 RepID=UPI003890787C
MTYKQATAAGAQVRKGEKSTHVQYWKFTEERIKRNDDGSIVLDKDDKPVKETVQLERPKVFIASVFNAERIDLPPMAVRQDRAGTALNVPNPFLKPLARNLHMTR